MTTNNPFRPAQRETYEQQLDLSAPAPDSSKGEDETDLLVDVGLSSSTHTQDTQPRFLESSNASLLPPSGGPIGPNNKLLSGSGTSQAGSTTYSSNQTAGSEAGGSGVFSRLCGFLSVEYYRPYFDVSSATVLERIKNGVSPHKKDIFGGNDESPPDLYGAVWISLTLVFLIGATSTLNSYFAHDSSKEPWERDYRLLTFASTMIFTYTFVVPLLIWAACLYAGVDPRPGLVKMVGAYGYTSVAFIPASLLCIIPVAGVQWVAVLIAGVCSGIVLVRNLWNLFGQNYSPLATQDTEAQSSLTGAEASQPSRTKSAFLLICGAAAIHFLFTLLLKLFFLKVLISLPWCPTPRSLAQLNLARNMIESLIKRTPNLLDFVL